MAVVQPPIRNASLIGASVYGHSGELGPIVTDLRLPGRGLDLEIVRSYRSSLADRAGELGRGWSLNLAKRVERVKGDLVYHDGAGLEHRWRRDADGFASPAGFYGVIAEEKRGVVIRHRYGVVSRFEAPERGGRLRSVEDRNRNTIALTYRADRIEILDALRRSLSVTLAKGRVSEIHDHAGRTWAYRYDSDDRLVEILQPATRLFPQGTTIRYEYDAAHRLVSLTDAKGQTWLVVRYDDAGRVAEQHHGSGTYAFEYELLGKGRSAGMRTACRLRNGGLLVVEHNAAGNPLTRTLSVRRDAFASDDMAGETGETVPLVTTSVYNRDFELVALTEPAGNSTTWEYAEGDDDPRNRGNCLRRTETPAHAAPADHPSLVTTWTRDRQFQVPLTVTNSRGQTTTHSYDARGNRTGTAFPPVTVQPIAADGTRPQPATHALETAYAFNSRGQLLRKTHIDGTVTAYDYYPVADPTGMGGPGAATSDPDAICGYLARVTRDAGDGRRRNDFRWDSYGNKVAVLDGARNAARRRYDAMGRLEAVVGREPFADTIEYCYDANGNEVESIQPFERLELDDTGEPVTRAGAVRELCAYDSLDNLVERTIAGGETRVSERFIRDADERVVRIVQPNGTVTELEYDERDLVLAVTRAAGTKEAVTERRTYTSNGSLRTVTDANGGTTTYHYDGYERYRGFTDPLGTTRRQWLDEAGNVVRVTVGDELLVEATYEYDEWDRLVRMDEAWRDAGWKHLGASGWDGREGVVSTLVEYGVHGRTARVWREGGNVVAVAYDGLGRVAEVEDLTGESASLVYDANGNLVEARFRGPRGEGELAETTVRMDYDGMDRLVSRRAEDVPPERFEYDSFGGVVTHVRPSGMAVRLLHDGVGRRVGHVLSADGVEDDTQRVARRLEFDDSYRLIAHTDGVGNRTSYRYDALDRQIGVTYPDGTEATAEYDAKGNVVRTVDAGGFETLIRYDASDRLVERRTLIAGSDAAEAETFEYDAIGRLVRATAPGGEVRRTHDSLSRVLTEKQGARTVRAAYDAAGRPIALDYPGGEAIRRTFDSRGRVTEVTTASGEPIAGIRYRAGEQIARLVVGGAIEATCAYDSQERLESVTYRRMDNGALVEGYRYARDDAGRIVHEVQASDGVGQRFWFDGFNRPVRARYGVKDVLDPASPFELETTYDWFPEGPWRLRRDTDGRGAVIAERHGTLDERNRYRRLGGASFAYDAVGNTIRQGTDNPGVCLYTYDGANRLVKVECFDANARRTRTIEYEYDALGRLVRKVVTDRAGVTTETTYVWAGTTLLEEYENGVLVRTYVYSIGSQPARLTVDQNGRSDYLYVHDGRGVVVGLVRANDPNAFAERYGYEITGSVYLKEVDGVPVDLPQRTATASSLWNSILSGDTFGSLMHDWASGTFTGADGRHLDANIASALNTNAALTGGVHTTIRTTMGKQFESFLGMLGLGGRNGGFVSHGGQGGQAAGDRSKNAETTVSSSGGGKSKGGAAESDDGGLGMAFMAREMALYSAGGDLGDKAGKAVDAVNKVVEATSGVGGVYGVDVRPGGGHTTEPGKQQPEPAGAPGPAQKGAEQLNPQSNPNPNAKNPNTKPSAEAEKKAQQATEAAAKQAQEAKEREAKEKEAKEKEAKEKEAKEKTEEKEAKEKTEEEKKDEYVDPEAQLASTMAVSSPEQVEMRLNGRKRPVGPNTEGQPQVDTSSPPPTHGGIDPTVARFDGEVYGGDSLERGEMKLSIAPIDYVRDQEPPTPTGGPTGGTGGDTDHDLGWP